MTVPADGPIDAGAAARTPSGARAAWAAVDEGWTAAVARARRLPEAARHERVGGEWSFVETCRHLVFVTDAWVRRVILGERAAYHRLGLPPDHGVGQPEPGVDVAAWGIDVFAIAAFEEVMEVRVGHMELVRQFIDRLTPAELERRCGQNPEPGFPPVTTFRVDAALAVVLGEEHAHQRFAARDLTVLERGAFDEA